MRLLLDAHVLLWTVYEPERLPQRIADLISVRDNSLFVSHSTLWELANKAAAGRLRVVGLTINDLLVHTRDLDAVLVPITLADILHAAALPWKHRDPFDRMLVAQARASGLALVSADDAIRAYDDSVIWE